MEPGSGMLKRNVMAMNMFVLVMLSGLAWANADEVPRVGPLVVPEEDSGDQGEPLEAGPESSKCAKTFISGVGDNRLSWCFSTDGNIVKMEYPEYVEYVRYGDFIEGFCLASDGVKVAETFGFIPSVGLSSPVVKYGLNKVKHTTLDGNWRIEQTFSQQPALKQITVDMKLFNLSGAVRKNVFVTRAVDADVIGRGGDLFVSGQEYVLATHPGTSFVRLSTTRDVVTTLIYPSQYPVINEGCYDSASDLTVISQVDEDRSMGLQVNTDTVPAGGNITFTFLYQLGY